MITCDREVLALPPIDVLSLQPCSQEEADTCIMLHVNHLYDNSIRRIKVIATDTDVVVLAVATAS